MRSTVCSLSINVSPSSFGRLKGVKVLLVQTPCKSGFPDAVRGISQLWAKSKAGVTSKAVAIPTLPSDFFIKVIIFINSSR
jgi:hypothetical protein